MFFFFSSRRRHTRCSRDWSSDVCSSDLFLFASLFWGAYEQAGSTLTLFADRYVRLELLSLKLYASWFVSVRSEEHTSELQSRLHLVCRLLLEKKKNKNRQPCSR